MKRIVRHALTAMYPPSGDLDGIEATDLGGFLDRFSAEAPGMMRFGVVAASLLYAASPPLTIRKLKPSFLLTQEELDEHSYRLATHSLYPVRLAVLSLKMAAGLCWGADPAVRQKLGLRTFEADPQSFRPSGDPS